ncbi:hypothetical protein ACKGJO_08335 [Gracilimonas sp. Q87]|uniref:hypothetical protein n=1 Tax=Gracilimonas sp. Q87 TaxID=3384766 RepID=UPI003983E4D0
MILKEHSLIQKIASVVAVIFGIITLIASSRILYLDSDPGYYVFLPLLIFNHIMGFVYLIAGYQIWKNKEKGKTTALIIFIINLLVLVIIGIIYLINTGVATDSLGAMSFRTAIWLLIFLSLKMTKK